MNDAQQPALQAGEVHKNYGTAKAREALAGVSLEVHPGECLALLGMNGAGKTTLIKCLLDLAAPTSGTLSIFAQDHSRPLSRKQLAYVRERFSPPGWLHARDYFRLAAHLHGLAFPQPGLLGMLAELDLEEDIWTGRCVNVPRAWRKKSAWQRPSWRSAPCWCWTNP
jgi:ABC-type multidrug transport system ATPase subunit